MLAASSLPSTDRAASPAPVRTPPPAPPSTPRFADLLQRGQATHGVLARPAETAPKPAETPPRDNAERSDDDTTPSQAQEAADNNPTAKANAKMAMRVRDKAPTTLPAKQPAPDVSSPDSTAQDATDVPKAGEGTVGTPPAGVAAQAAELRDWLAALKTPLAATASAAEADANATVAEGTAATAAGPDLTSRSAAANARAKVADAGDAPGAAGANALVAADGARFARLAVAAEALTTAERRPAPVEAPVVHDPAPNPFTGAAGAAPRSFDAATLPPIALPAPLHSPAFAQVLGAQVSVLARDGVQQAELHLNPADMGPISVQIEIDGTQARVDFQASAAETRDVIERGLPELASALREQGLTLSGGGVFQHAPDRGNGDGRERAGAASRVGRSVAEDVANAAPRTVAMRVPQGRVDLYA